jgi:hypothetical protein
MQWSGDSPADLGDGARWMSFEELAAVRGISKPSAVKLVRRHKWRRQRDNQGHVRALVPTEWATREETWERDSPADSPPSSLRDISRITNAFEAAVSSLTERAQAAEARADRAEQARDSFRAELTSAEGRAGAERQRADRAEAARDTAQAELAGAQEALAGAETRLREAEQARAEFWSRSRWARVRSVWRGTGG